MFTKRKRLAICGAGSVAAIALAVVLAAAPAVAIGSWSTPVFVYAASSIQSPGYAYAPSAIAGSPERVYTCHSRASGTVRDDIFLTTINSGTVVSSASVLAGSSGWDSYHDCDPSVVQVDAVLSGRTYSYAMFYLGNDQSCSCHNQIGVAYSDSLDGPWVKVQAPVIAFDPSAPTSDWGAGQPTATTINPSDGTVVLAWTEGYSSGGTVAKMAQVSLLSGAPVVSGSHLIPTSGLTTSSGGPDYTNNFDLVYSTTRDRFFMVRELHPYPSGGPDYISSAVQVASIAGSDMWAGTGSWQVESNISSAVTGAERTHNPGFLRSVNGTLPNESEITVVYTSASLDPGSLWTYALWRTTAPL